MQDSIRAFAGPSDNDSVLATLPIGTVVRAVARSKVRDSGTGGLDGFFWYNVALRGGQSAWIYGSSLYEMGSTAFLDPTFHGEIKLEGKSFRFGVAAEEDRDVRNDMPDDRHGVPFVVQDSKDDVRFLTTDSFNVFGEDPIEGPHLVRLVDGEGGDRKFSKVRIHGSPNHFVVQFEGSEELQDGEGNFLLLAKLTADSLVVTNYSYTSSDPNPRGSE